MPALLKIRLRPLERDDLRFVHQLDNNASTMRYWFEEPYVTFSELHSLYDQHVHDRSERRFIIECDAEHVGLADLVEIDPCTGAPNSRSSSRPNTRAGAGRGAPRRWCGNMASRC